MFRTGLVTADYIMLSHTDSCGRGRQLQLQLEYHKITEAYGGLLLHTQLAISCFEQKICSLIFTKCLKLIDTFYEAAMF